MVPPLETTIKSVLNLPPSNYSKRCLKDWIHHSKVVWHSRWLQLFPPLPLSRVWVHLSWRWTGRDGTLYNFSSNMGIELRIVYSRRYIPAKRQVVAVGHFVGCNITGATRNIAIVPRKLAHYCNQHFVFNWQTLFMANPAHNFHT